MKTAEKHFRKRDAILNCIRGTTTHPSAEWVYEHVRKEVPDISLATVYRNLALFKEQGLIISVGNVNGIERIDGNTEPHVHFICTSCGKVLDLPQMEVPQTLCNDAAGQTGGEVNGCQLTFTGSCRECSKKQSVS